MYIKTYKYRDSCLYRLRACSADPRVEHSRVFGAAGSVRLHCLWFMLYALCFIFKGSGLRVQGLGLRVRVKGLKSRLQEAGEDRPVLSIREGWRQFRERGCASRGYITRQHKPSQQGRGRQDLQGQGLRIRGVWCLVCGVWCLVCGV